MKVKTNGVELFVDVSGKEGAPCVTFVTGITNDHTLWDDQVGELSADYRLIRIDSRGHGRSQSTPAPYSLETIVADVAGVWDALRVERSVIAGLGLGGVVAAEIGESVDFMGVDLEEDLEDGEGLLSGDEEILLIERFEEESFETINSIIAFPSFASNTLIVSCAIDNTFFAPEKLKFNERFASSPLLDFAEIEIVFFNKSKSIGGAR